MAEYPFIVSVEPRDEDYGSCKLTREVLAETPEEATADTVALLKSPIGRRRYPVLSQLIQEDLSEFLSWSVEIKVTQVSYINAKVLINGSQVWTTVKIPSLTPIKGGRAAMEAAEEYLKGLIEYSELRIVIGNKEWFLNENGTMSYTETQTFYLSE